MNIVLTIAVVTCFAIGLPAALRNLRRGWRAARFVCRD